MSSISQLSTISLKHKLEQPLKADAESSSKYLDQPKYEGEMKNGLKHGKGTYYFENGNRFQGFFVDDFCSGIGIYYCQDGTKFKGNFTKGFFLNGKGKQIAFDGFKQYEGQFKNNQYQGKGVIYFGDDQWIQSQFKDGLVNGKTKVFDNGDIYQGQIQQGNWIGIVNINFENGNTYSGLLKDFCFIKGKLVIPEYGIVYQGQFYKGKCHGEGKLTLKNGYQQGTWHEYDILNEKEF